MSPESSRRMCAQIRRWLPLFVGEELPEGTDLPIEEHLLACERCAAYEDALRSDRLRLARYRREQRRRRLPRRVADGEAFWAELQVAIAAAGPELRRTTPLPAAPRRLAPAWPAVLRTGLAAAAVLAAALIYGNFLGDGQGDLPASSPLRTDLPSRPPVRPAAVVPAVPVGAEADELPPPTYPLDGWRAPGDGQGEVLNF